MASSMSLNRILPAIATSLTAIALAALPSRAAERVILDYGIFSRTIPVTSLEAYAQDGSVDENLAFYLRLLGPEREADFKTALTASREVDLVKVSRWFYAPMGERMLAFAGDLFQTGARLNGQRALRAALIASAAEDGSVSLLDLLRHYPTESVRLNLPLAISSTRQVLREADETLALVAAVADQSRRDAAQRPLAVQPELPDLTQPGPYGVRQLELMLQDPTRTGPGAATGPRTYPVDLFLPQNLAAIDRPIPVVVISHGLGDTRMSFRDVGAHVASYGFAVALPEHIGSDLAYQQELFQGLRSDTFAASDFLDRPLDISFLLDELERTNQTAYGGKLDLNRVAIAGHSFGGYTALALGGATIDFERLARRCDPNANFVLDAALLLECRALELTANPAQVQQLGTDGVRDPRVKLVMAFAPVSNLFGEQGIRRIDLPVMILGGAFDIIAPVVPQQAAAFSWLQTPDRYFYLADNTSHSPGITGLTSRIFNIDQQFEQGVEEGLVVSRRLNKSLVVAFCQVYLLQDEAYRPFLSAAYVEDRSEKPFTFHLVHALPQRSP